MAKRIGNALVWRISWMGSARENSGLLRASASVPVRVPLHIVRRYFVHNSRNGRKVRGNVMFETVFTNVTQQFLHARNLDHSGAAEGLQRIISEPAFAHVAANHAVLVISGKARETHRRGLHLTHARSEGVILPHRAGDDLLIIHAHLLE